MKVLKTRNPDYDAMKKGERKYTGRAGASAGTKDYWNTNIYEKIQIQLVDDNDSPINGENFEAEIIKMTKYNPPQSIEDACKDLGAENLLLGAHSVEDAVKKYYSFKGYEERIKKYGLVVIKIK